ncbi:YdcF family protein [Chondrinema litorale]|uniref:YdcF family protein n=1 Tax=Chondrinema litorale TaxID=2994555 RepID=UPI0025432896|nr:YdcF family protein [Chondrinema litorale]UZR98765.1 YdcF family protein [Chondrinema litorale]
MTTNKTIFLLALIFILPYVLLGQQYRLYNPVNPGNYVQDKNFYLLTLFEKIPELNKVLAENSTLSKIASDKKNALQNAAQNCREDLSCHTNGLIWTDDEIELIGKELQKLTQSSLIFKQLIEQHIKPSGYFQLYNELDNESLILKSWEDAANGINRLINVYALAEKPHYAKIDSVSYNINGVYYQRLVDCLNGILAEQTDEMSLFFQPSLAFTLGLMEINNRDEAARFEPMEVKENATALQHIPNINWNDYPYSVILVPGHGPDEAHLALSPLGKLRDELAAKRYKEGKAPLIIVSGGYVHPFQTPFCEAIEMKKDLIERLGIPESAILIEPHARHTTTNFRNAARLIYQYGIPADKLALVTTTKYQSYYISDMGLDKRSMEELGYVPYQLHKRLNQHDIEFSPKIESLHRDNSDALDP